jgi:hypothetical protein
MTVYASSPFGLESHLISSLPPQAMAAWLRSAGAPGRRLTIFMPLRLQTAEVPKALQACGRITAPTSMQPMYAIRTETKKGIATPKEELELASKRYKDLVRSLRRS